MFRLVGLPVSVLSHIASGFAAARSFAEAANGWGSVHMFDSAWVSVFLDV